MPDELTNLGGPGSTPDGQSPQAPAQSQQAENGSEKMVRESDLKALRRTLDRQITEKNNALQATQARLAALEAQYRQQVTRGMDEEELRLFNLQEYERNLRAREDYIASQQTEQAKLSLFRKISKLHGIPVEDLEEAENPDHAWELGATYSQQKEEERIEAKARERLDKRASNQDVDLGTGRAPVTIQGLAQRFQDGDSQGYVLDFMKSKRG